MRLIEIEAIDADTFVSSNVAASSESEYDDSTTYSDGEKVKVSFETDGITARRPVEIYESLTNSNVGNYPPDDATNWVFVEVSNRWAMFDSYVNTQTENADSIEVVIDVTGMNCLAIFNNYGIEATLTYDGVTQTISLIRDSIKDWWDYFFAPGRIGRDAIFYFPTSSGNATLTITYEDVTAKCGLVAIGVARDIGITMRGVEMGSDGYSIIDTDGSGQTYLSAGNWAKRASAPVRISADDMDAAYRLIVANRANPTIFDYNEYDVALGTRHTSQDKFQSAIIYGFTEDFESIWQNSRYFQADHEAQGMI